MAIPKGNFVALQPLKPVELKVGDFIEKKIDDYIKSGQAAEAARIKRMQEEGKTLSEINKGIKVDAIQTIAPIQRAATKLSKDAMQAKSYAMSIAEDYRIPIDQRREAMRIAEAKAQNVVTMSKYIGSADFMQAYQKKLNTPMHERWEGDESLQYISDLASGDHDIKFDENTGSLLVAFPNPDHDSEEKVVWKDFTEISTKLTQPFKKDLTKETDSLIGSQASKLYEKRTDGRGGERVTEKNVFLRDEANKTFETYFGGFNVNSKDPILEQFSYNVLGKRSIASQEDYDLVKKAYVDLLETKIPKDTSIIDKDSAQDKEAKAWAIKNAKKNFYSQGSSQGGGGSQEIVQPILSNGTSPVQIRDKKGAVLGNQNWNIVSASLPKLKGKPTTENSFAVGSVKDSKGRQNDYWLMGAPAEDGTLVYSKIPEKDFNEYVSKLGYNPIAVKANLTSQKRALNRPTGQMSANTTYNNTKISFKSKDVQDGSTDNGDFTQAFQTRQTK